ncbi:nuclear transport factor 2 family protein [Flavobacterium cellulosilyticum]|uniref:Nuclear transport factor 2 family protein n=1 Tax=Flavobacterium cellulosilyticum TaxID=2541731 RepID=A0A4V2YZR3_9FLAO|nr:nuclear transport factor 2 family protein [Flavobacterium cellulosilyticum]TDD97827.1 nuclear transport factor 2 family protein [Flavobacterium cellulosilyticum]
MRKVISIVLFMSIWITFAQKKTNGTIYIEHPAITAVEAMTQAFVSGDTDKVASYLADDFKLYSGTSINKNDKGKDKESFLKDVKFWKDNLDYLSISRTKGAYPDALEYNDPNNKELVWVQTWEDVKGVHNKTGVNIDMPVHRLYTVDKNNKIKTIIDYSTSKIGDEIGQSFSDRKNGEIYNHHEYINDVRKMIYAFVNKDFDKAYSFYDDEARFSDINSPIGKSISLTEQKANDKKLLDNFEITGVDINGYPDYLHYELGDTRVVQSWWTYRLIRKLDKKAIDLPVLYIDDFNDKGKIISEIAYYSLALLEAK